MYIRFVITQIDEDSHQPQGLFVAMAELLRSGTLTPDEHEKLQHERAWFNTNLPSPDRSDIRGRAIFWFRASAYECIQRMWNMGAILRENGYLMEVQKCDHLHNIVYRDEFQVAAFPHLYDGNRTFK